ncbi:MAG: PHP domain-containing protein [Chloroflexi bacterium]|nr:PHP domain-containing protein [Chloroflexota bacterium]MDA8189532.1 PHP domain-containing protein [Dehalococcoidales bacterium]
MKDNNGTDVDYWGKADLHIHSASGDGLASVAEIMQYIEETRALDVIAITDHDEIRGAYETRELAARRNLNFEVIVGSEITTLDGHLIALFIEEPIRMLQSLEKTIAAVHRQGGLCVVPHPMSWLTLSVGHKVLLRVMNSPSPDIYFDGIEMMNSSIAGRVAYKKAKDFNATILGLAELGGSDAHHLHLIGSAYTLFQGKTANELRNALLEKRTKAAGKFLTANEQLQGAASQQLKSLVIHPSQKLYRALSKNREQE